MIEIICLAAVIWIVMTLLEPFIARVDGIKESDREHAFERWQRTQELEKYNREFERTTPMPKQKKEPNLNWKRKRQKFKERKQLAKSTTNSNKSLPG